MDSINPTILKTTIEAIPLLAEDNFTIWRTRMQSLLNLAKLKDAMTLPDDLEPEDNSILTSIIISKLSPGVHSNIITADNEEDAKAIWSDLLKNFVSSKPANRAWVYKNFATISFDEANIQHFITEIKTGITRLHKIGIVLPPDILAYMILDKLPSTPALKAIQQSITHSAVESEITPDAVLDHLRIHLNEQKMTSGLSQESSSLSLYTDVNRKCKQKKHNPLANHPKHKCWMLYPPLRPQSSNQDGSDNTTTTKDQ